jgi:hypothetical protein
VGADRGCRRLINRPVSPSPHAGIRRPRVIPPTAARQGTRFSAT